MSDSTCMVCLETIQENQDSYQLHCQHIFHTKCIMDWFRSRSSSGNCPLCNDNPNANNAALFYGSKQYYEERYKQIKKYVNKNKKEYPEIKNQMDKIKDLEKETKEKRKIQTDYLKETEVKLIRKKMREQQSDYWKSVRKENKEKMKIISKYPLLMV